MSTTSGFALEVGRELSYDQLPAYAPMLAAYHRAHADELRAMLADLPLAPGAIVLDMACGAGTYTCWLAELVGEAGRVVGVDIAPAYLAQAREAADRTPYNARINFQQGDVAALPFDNHTFDLVWCAQSMYSLPDPHAALRELRRITRVGGTVAIFENDTVHQLVLPWPAELELAVRSAQLRALRSAHGDNERFFIGRELCSSFEAAGFTTCSVRSYATTRHAPLSRDEYAYLRAYLDDLAARARPFLTANECAWLDQLITPGTADYMLDQSDFYVTYLSMVALGE
ncbi:methyltransferase domain-containing protein [Candidatus Gracilibacteria bacterium]|nr:methyltransferase domain-containing protein [Candidatus Gracilibacteria bacterium]